MHVVRETNMPACLIELGFISNRADYNLIMNNKDRFDKAIAKRICKFNGVVCKESSKGLKKVDYSGRKGKVISNELNAMYNRWVSGIGTPKVIGVLIKGQIVLLEWCEDG